MIIKNRSLCPYSYMFHIFPLGNKILEKTDFVCYFRNPYMRSPLVRSIVIVSNATKLGKVYRTVLHVSKSFFPYHLSKELLQGFRKPGCFLLHFSQLIRAGSNPACGHVFNLRTGLEKGGAKYRQT